MKKFTSLLLLLTTLCPREGLAIMPPYKQAEMAAKKFGGCEFILDQEVRALLKSTLRHQGRALTELELDMAEKTFFSVSQMAIQSNDFHWFSSTLAAIDFIAGPASFNDLLLAFKKIARVSSNRKIIDKALKDLKELSIWLPAEGPILAKNPNERIQMLISLLALSEWKKMSLSDTATLAKAYAVLSSELDEPKDSKAMRVIVNAFQTLYLERLDRELVEGVVIHSQNPQERLLLFKTLFEVIAQTDQSLTQLVNDIVNWRSRAGVLATQSIISFYSSHRPTQ